MTLRPGRAPGPRRTLGRRAALGLGAAVALAGGGSLLARALAPRRQSVRGLHRDPSGTFDLPEGFSCVVLERRGDAMSDGRRVPGRPDGMGCFEGPSGTLVLMRNHELLPDDEGPWREEQPAEAFDPASKGGVTRLVVDPAALREGRPGAVRSSNLVLTGTNFNCAGGHSPWGWLSCEENVAPGHGFVFVCDIDADRVAPARPVPSFGRFRHEAAAVDPATGVVYLTEDREDACLYRFVPRDRSRPFEGRLEALSIRSAPGIDASATARPGGRRDVTWVPVEDPEPVDDLVRSRARAGGAAAFRRLEGADFAEGSLVFTATSGGREGLGQVFRLTPDRASGTAPGGGGVLTLLHEATDHAALSMPDNVVVSPWGDIYLAEDGRPPCGIRCLTRRGDLRPLASGALSGGEIAGLCFAPGGDILFANLQADGLTVAIVGPFERFAS